MWTQTLMILLGAVLSSALTLGMAYYFFERHYKKRLEEEIDTRIDELQKRLQNVLDEEAEEVGRIVEARVRKGVLDAVASIPSSEVLQETTQSVVKTGVGLMEAGLNTFLRSKPRKR